MSEVKTSQTITVRRDYTINVPDKFHVSGWHEDQSHNGHLMMTTPDSISGHRTVFNAFLSKAQFEAMRAVIDKVLAGWDAEVQ